MSDPRDPSNRGFVPLFWRLFIPNATVLTAACVVLMIEPANGRIVALLGGLALMLATNLILMRRAIAPLRRLTTLMEEVDPLQPGRRLPPPTPPSEVTALTVTFNRMLARLEAERRQSGLRALTAQEAERRRIALELHDEIGQQLTALVIELDHLGRDAPEPLQPGISRAASTAKGALNEVRGLAHRLRPEVLDELGLVPALRNLCDRLESGTGLVVRRSLPAELPSLDPDAELVIYRVAQESLTNVARHADADAAELKLAADGDDVTLCVADNGRGIAPATFEASSGGIRGMRERALSIGAALELAQDADGGTTVRLHVPHEAG